MTLLHRTASDHMTDLDPREGGARTMVDVTEAPAAPVENRRRDFRLLRTQRVLQIVLGLFWLLDAGLQFQPYMFGSGFTTTYLLNNAHNQPDVVRWIITNVGNFVGPHVAVWNTFFALIQVAIGLDCCSARPCDRLSQCRSSGPSASGSSGKASADLTGSASALTGAPGSVFLYGLIGLMAWPRKRPPNRRGGGIEQVGMASSAAAQGIGGAARPLLVWCGYWSLAAILFLLPDNRTPTSVSSAITGMSAGEPSTYAHFLDQLWWPLRERRPLDHMVAGHRLPHHRVRATRLPASATPFLAAGGLLAGLLLDQWSGSGRHLHRLGHRPQLGAPDRAPGPRHGAGREPRDPATWLSPFSTALFR